MNPEALIRSLSRLPAALPPLLDGIDVPASRWRPASGGWSIREITGHLGDEELDDFPPRLASTLQDPRRTWTPIDPERAVADRNHQDTPLDGLVARFLDARREALRWLQGLSSPDWALSYEHPALGPLRAGDLLASWAAHDLLHLRQLTHRLHGLGESFGEPYGSAYAGPWTSPPPMT